MKFKTKEEWQSYLKTQFTGSYGGYAVVKAEEKIELLYFAKHSFEGEPWFLEAPNYLRRIKIENGDNIKDFEDYGYLILDGYAYEIDTPQCSPFLPDEIEILEIIGGSEGKALDYLLKYDYKDAVWKN